MGSKFRSCMGGVLKLCSPNASFSPKARTGTRLAPVSKASFTKPFLLAVSCRGISLSMHFQTLSVSLCPNLFHVMIILFQRMGVIQLLCVHKCITRFKVPGAARKDSDAPPGISKIELPGPLQIQRLVILPLETVLTFKQSS